MPLRSCLSDSPTLDMACRMINTPVSGDQGMSYAMLVKLIGEEPPIDISIYGYIAEQCEVPRQSVKMLIIGKSYGMSNKVLAEEHGITGDIAATVLNRFPGLEHLLK